VRSLADIEKHIEAMAPDESLWQAGAGERGVTSATFYTRLRKCQRAAGLQGCRAQASTFFGTLPPSCVAMLATRSSR
jgi:hypothetical protein